MAFSKFRPQPKNCSKLETDFKICSSRKFKLSVLVYNIPQSYYLIKYSFFVLESLDMWALTGLYHTQYSFLRLNTLGIQSALHTHRVHNIRSPSTNYSVVDGKKVPGLFDYFVSGFGLKVHHLVCLQSGFFVNAFLFAYPCFLHNYKDNEHRNNKSYSSYRIGHIQFTLFSHIFFNSISTRFRKRR